ncbi:Brd4-Interacting Chromatin-Remodeling Complex-Associated Protein-Like [Manis pentadactyla]|nr:Brd4-Interacting Chromatin-Remodeling Complex-Associated Protein-Like [Manis pentadactyla]
MYSLETVQGWRLKNFGYGIFTGFHMCHLWAHTGCGLVSTYALPRLSGSRTPLILQKPTVCCIEGGRVFAKQSDIQSP